MNDSREHPSAPASICADNSPSGSDSADVVAASALPTAQWTTQLAPRIKRQFDFLLAVDALKKIKRASRISDGSRTENSAEHSWHLTLFANVLAEYADEPINLDRVVTMLMVHDIVEIDAGDVPLHAPQRANQAEKEQAAASRLFGLLPDDQAQTLKHFWEEFELAHSADAKFAKAVDRLQPILLNMLNDGGTWSDFSVSAHQAIARTAGIQRGSATLWNCANAMFEDAVNRGWLKTDQPADSS